jgi:hypothetical protein
MMYLNLIQRNLLLIMDYYFIIMGLNIQLKIVELDH